MPPPDPPPEWNPQERFRLLVEGATEYALFLVGRDGRIASWNEGARRITGYSPEEAVGQPSALIFTPEDRAAGVPERELDTAAREGRAADVRWYRRKDGGRFWADGMMRRLDDDAGEPRGFAKVFRDATGEREAARLLTQSEERYAALFRAIDVGFCVIEMLFDAQDRPTDYRFLEANAAFGRHAGDLDAADVVGRTAREVVPGLDAFWFETYGRVAITGQEARFENYVPAMDRWFDVYALRVDRPEERRVAILFTDISERKAAQEALRASEERFRDAQTRVESALLAGDIGTWSWDIVREGVRGDANLARLFSLAPDDLAAGRVSPQNFFDAIHEEDRPRAERSVADALAGRQNYEAEYRVVLPDGSHLWVASRGRVLLDASGSPVFMSGAVVDITERVERERRERFLAELAERARALTDPEAVIADAVRSAGEFLGLSRCTFADIDSDADTCIIRLDYCAPGVRSIAGVLPWSSFGPAVNAELAARRAVVVEDAHADPERVPPEFVSAYDGIGVRAHVTVPAFDAGRLVSVISAQSATPRRWTPEEADLLVVLAERTSLTVQIARQQRALRDGERRERARLAGLFEQAPAFMCALRGPRHTYELANLPYYRLIGKEADFPSQAILGKSLAEVIPEVAEQGFIDLLDHVYRTGEVYVGTDTRVVFRPGDDAPADERFVDFTFQPLREEDGAVSGILVHGIDLTERKRLEQEHERLLAESRARAERETLVNRIGAAVRAALDPDEVLRVAVEALGRAMGADRCYYVSYDQARDRGNIVPDWWREGAGLSSIAGEYRMSDYAVNREAGYRRGETQVIEDVFEHAAVSPAAADSPPVSLMAHLGLRSLVRAPLVSGGVMTVLAVAMSDGPRRWTEEEVRLVEIVAAQTRAAVEAARVQQRERNIAQTLQAALQPPPPDDLPGLALEGFYRPALAEAGVGGDFYDVFPIEKGCTALVVGDLSGKGLAAASEVATVRNMVRYALYSSRSVAEAITGLDRILVEHGLLSGFATLFVGVYDHAARTLTYVNCGQEPALVRRAATNAVEELAPTGSVLGGFAGGDFTEATVTLTPDDVLAVFTDGLTDVGPGRRDLLGAEGVRDLLRDGCAEAARARDARAVVERLVAGADAYGRGGTGDDIALLVGVVGGSVGGAAVGTATGGD